MPVLEPCLCSVCLCACACVHARFSSISRSWWECLATAACLDCFRYMPQPLKILARTCRHTLTAWTSSMLRHKDDWYIEVTVSFITLSSEENSCYMHFGSFLLQGERSGSEAEVKTSKVQNTMACRQHIWLGRFNCWATNVIDSETDIFEFTRVTNNAFEFRKDQVSDDCHLIVSTYNSQNIFWKFPQGIGQHSERALWFVSQQIRQNASVFVTFQLWNDLFTKPSRQTRYHVVTVMFDWGM